MKKKVAIFHVSMGSGHEKAAYSIKDAILREDKDLEVQVLDFLDFVPVPLRKSTVEFYYGIIKYAPFVYDIAFHLSKKAKNYDSKEIKSLLGLFGYHEFKKFMDEFKPDISIATHLFPAVAASKYKRHCKNLKIFEVNTDFFVHPLYFFKNIDYYVIPNDEIRQEFPHYLEHSQAILPYGIPLDLNFSKEANKEEKKRELGLLNIPTLLVMGGGLGLGNIEEVVNIVTSNFKKEIQIIVIAGRNEQLFKRVKAIAESKERNTSKIVPFGWVDNVYDYMKASDLFISKAGGVSLAEALACSLPTIVVNPLPGQEKTNAKFLSERSILIWLEDLYFLKDEIENVIFNQDTLNEYRKKAEKYAKPFASRDIAKHLIKVL